MRKLAKIKRRHRHRFSVMVKNNTERSFTYSKENFSHQELHVHIDKMFKSARMYIFKQISKS